MNECDQETEQRKGVFPYEYVDSVAKLAETKLPPIEAFYSNLNDEDISEENYEHAKTVWNEFYINNLGEYQQLYNECDVLLLADVFDYKLDPAWYYTSPSLAWDAMLKYTAVTLNLLVDGDIDMFVRSP